MASNLDYLRISSTASPRSASIADAAGCVSGRGCKKQSLVFRSLYFSVSRFSFERMER